MALRLLVLRAVEKVCSKPKSQDAIAFFKDVVGLARIVGPGIDFAQLLVGIGRQVEPKTVTALFPLPDVQCDEAANDSGDDKIIRATVEDPSKVATVRDLYALSSQLGALSVPTIALPLLESRLMSLEETRDVLYHCLSTVLQNTDKPDFDYSAAERSLIEDLFRFGSQMEDLDDSEFWGDDDVAVVAPPVSVASPRKKDTGKSGTIEPRMTPKKDHSSSRSFASMLLPQSLLCRGRKNREERAVYEGASNFIVSGFEEGDYEVVVKADDTTDRREGITWMLGAFLVRASLQQHKWKLVSALSSRMTSGDAPDDTLSSWIDSRRVGTVRDFCRRQMQAERNRNNEKETKDENDQDNGGVLRYLHTQIRGARIGRSEATALIRFGLLLLSRLRAGPVKNEAVGVGLILIVLVAGGVVDTDSLDGFGSSNELETALRGWQPPVGI